MKIKAFHAYVLSILALLYLAYFFFYPPDAKEIRMEINVTEKSNVLGFNVTGEGFYFGSTGPRSTVSKNVTIAGTNNEIVFVHITASGNISPWVRVSHNNFFIIWKEAKDVAVYVLIPANAAPGAYDGALKISYKRVL